MGKNVATSELAFYLSYLNGTLKNLFLLMKKKCLDFYVHFQSHIYMYKRYLNKKGAKFLQGEQHIVRPW